MKASLVDSSADVLLRAALEEDLDGRGAAGDLTTRLVLAGTSPAGVGRIVAKASGRLSGVAVAKRVFELVDPELEITCRRADGDAVSPGDEVMRITGSAASLLAAERTALNVLQRLSGVATLTAAFVDRVAGTDARILDTRKTTPGWRALEKEAVRHGGGHNHRYGLFDEVLIKENHFAMAGVPYRETLERVRAAAPEGTRIVAEARDPDEARAVADGGADVIMLDNFTVEGMRRAIAALAGHPRRAAFEFEASGGVNLETVAEIASTGVERISVGSLTHSAPALDLSMLIDAEPAAVR